MNNDVTTSVVKRKVIDYLSSILPHCLASAILKAYYAVFVCVKWTEFFFDNKSSTIF